MTTLPHRQPGARTPHPPQFTSPVCEVCLHARPVVHDELPGLPLRGSRCADCKDAGAVPWWMLVARSHDAGGVHLTNKSWLRVIADTLEHLDIPLERFEQAVIDYGRNLGRYRSMP